MYGKSIVNDGLGCDIIMAKANIVLGPHSLECRVLVLVLHEIQVELLGYNLLEALVISNFLHLSLFSHFEDHQSIENMFFRL